VGKTYQKGAACATHGIEVVVPEQVAIGLTEIAALSQRRSLGPRRGHRP